MLEPSAISVLLVSILTSTTAASLVSWFKDRKKDKAIEAGETVDYLRDILTELRTENTRLSEKLKAARCPTCKELIVRDQV